MKTKAEFKFTMPNGEIAALELNVRNAKGTIRRMASEVYRFYQDPENLKRFEEWKANRYKKTKEECHERA